MYFVKVIIIVVSIIIISIIIIIIVIIIINIIIIMCNSNSSSDGITIGISSSSSCCCCCCNNNSSNKLILSLIISLKTISIHFYFNIYSFTLHFLPIFYISFLHIYFFMCVGVWWSRKWGREGERDGVEKG